MNITSSCFVVCTTLLFKYDDRPVPPTENISIFFMKGNAIKIICAITYYNILFRYFPICLMLLDVSACLDALRSFIFTLALVWKYIMNIWICSDLHGCIYTYIQLPLCKYMVLTMRTGLQILYLSLSLFLGSSEPVRQTAAV